jgi:hypothetical protein
MRGGSGRSCSVTVIVQKLQEKWTKLCTGIDKWQEKNCWKKIQSNIRKQFFSDIKHIDGSLEPIFHELLTFLSSETSELLKVFIVDLALDIQELLKASVCKQKTCLRSQCVYFLTVFHTVYDQCTNLLLKFKLTQLKIVVYDCLTYNDQKEPDNFTDVAYVIKNNMENISEELFNIMKKDCVGIVVYDLEDRRVHGLFTSDFQDSVFFSEDGMVLEANISDIYLLQRRELYYIAIKGNFSESLVNYFLVLSFEFSYFFL